MKRNKLFVVMTALALSVFFLFTACGGDDDDDTGGGGGSLGGSLAIDVDVYEVATPSTQDLQDNPAYAYIPPYKKSSKSVDVTAYPGTVTGTITNGHLKITLGEPAVAALQPIADIVGDGGDSTYEFQPSSGVKGTGFGLSAGNSYLDKSTEKLTIGKGGSVNYTRERVSYLYVDTDVTITAKGPAHNENAGYQFPFPVAFKATNETIKLKKGWNAIYSKETIKGNADDAALQGSSTTKAGDNKNVHWVLHTGYGY